MSLETIPGQARAKRFLRQLIQTGHVPHALLFSGMAGIGKASMAREFAKVLNCLDAASTDSCDLCGSCHKIDGGIHPDLAWITSEGTFIKLDQVRDLRKRIRYRPFEGAYRVIVIEDAQKLREEAANALLKILEEPPKQHIFILLALEPQMLLPTIVSRCCHVRFQPLEDNLIEQHLTGTYQLEPNRAREIARLAEGSMERAKWLVEENHILHWKEILGHVQNLHKLSMIEFFELMANWAKKSADLEQDFLCIKLWLRDVILSRLLEDHRPAFELTQIPDGIRDTSMEYLFSLYDQIEEAVQHLRGNANKQLTLEGVCLAIKDNSYGQGSWDSLSKRR
ncbi:MAG: DNA polymerase III subunit delta' [Desulfoferrobacter sp.]